MTGTYTTQVRVALAKQEDSLGWVRTVVGGTVDLRLVGEDRLEVLLRIDAAGVDGEAGVFLREAPRGARQSPLVPNDVQHVRRVTAVEH